MAMSGMHAIRADTPWRRLPWTAPLALVVWALALWAMSLALVKVPAGLRAPPPINARFIELSKPPALPPAPAAAHPESPPAPSLQPHPRQRTTRHPPAQAANTAEPATAQEQAEPAPSPSETAVDLPQSNASTPQATQALPGATARPAASGKPRFANHPGAAVRAGAVGVVPPPQDLTVGNEERPFDDGMGAGWSPGGWAQDSNAEDCINDPTKPGPCPGQVFTQPGRPWCYDANPIYNWDLGTCKDKFDRATAAFKRQDYAAAFALFTQLAEKEYSPAQSNLCTMYVDGTGAPRDTQLAVHWCSKAAKEGDPKATYHLALMYSDGIGVPKDDRQAAFWYRKAAYYGYANAQYNLGVMYMQGIGVPQDDKQAVYWYRKAAYRGNAAAQYNLGVMYAEGAGVPQDDKQAVYWYCKGVMRGDDKAQVSLAKLYSDVTASPAREELNYFCWVYSADKRNNVIAYANRDLYDRNLTAEQRERAIATAAAWKRK